MRWLRPLLLLAAIGTGSCDTFPSPCRSQLDCAEGSFCEQGECVPLGAALLDDCRSDGGTAAIEKCNGLDDDCDGNTDEGCEAGEACTNGFGLCARAGELTETPVGLVCSAQPGEPEPEGCDTLDNDCDGAVDEDCVEGERCAVGVGLCRNDGFMRRQGRRLVCDVRAGTPVDEVCGNRLDDDCDGTSDEGFDTLGEACEIGVGECARMGALACIGGEVRCDAETVAAVDEICDRKDNDCDGTADEGFGTGEPCTVGVGACRSTAETICNASRDGAICPAVEGLPGAEDCNGIDDDCNGVIDDGPGGLPLTRVCGTNMGECTTGTERCAGGMWSGVCEGAVAAVPEVCDGLDNNCDGTIDQFVRPCGDTDVGACEFGVQQCQNARWLACEGAVEPAAEDCNGIDDDCDGVVDNAPGGEVGSLTSPCGSSEVGECRLGVQTCLTAQRRWSGVCMGDVGPVDELCDGLDNDCDNRTDEDFLQLGQACTAGAGLCNTDGTYVCRPDGLRTLCNAQPAMDRAQPETCNNFDDDCDGRLDETFFIGQPCVDANARVGQCRCAPNQGVACEVVVDGVPVLRPGVEQPADTADNDCDGRVDEGA